MKRINIKKYIAVILLASFFMGCSDVLDEKPRGIFTPDYFKTKNNQQMPNEDLTHLFNEILNQ